MPRIAIHRRRRSTPVDASDSVLIHTRQTRLGEFDVFGTRAFGAAAFGVGHGLTNIQRFDGGSFERTVMKEQVAPLSLDESKTLVGQQLLNRALRHTTTPS